MMTPKAIVGRGRAVSLPDAAGGSGHYALINNVGDSPQTFGSPQSSIDITMSNVVADTDNYAGPNANCLTVPTGLGGLYLVSATTLPSVAFATTGFAAFTLFALDALSAYFNIVDALNYGWNVFQFPGSGVATPEHGPVRPAPSRLVFLDEGYVVHWQAGNALDVSYLLNASFGEGGNSALGLWYVGPV